LKLFHFDVAILYLLFMRITLGKIAKKTPLTIKVFFISIKKNLKVMITM